MSSQLAYYEFMGYSSEVLRERYAIYAARFPAGATVADIGCGRGEFLDLLRGRGARGIGVDADAEMVESARGRGLEAVQADGVEFLTSRRGSLDGVFAAHLVEHLVPERLENFVGAAAEALRPGGQLILVTPNPRNLEVQLREFWVDLQHTRFYSPDILRWVVERAGLVTAELGENPAYAAGPIEIRRPQSPLVSDHDGTAAESRAGRGGRLDRARAATGLWLLPHATEERLLELERRVDLMFAWAQSLYPPGEYFVVAVRPEEAGR